jgi:hypothetical protein
MLMSCPPIDVYKPQVRPFDISRSSHGAEKESLVISNDLVETDELDLLGHIYREQDGKIFLDPTLTAVCLSTICFYLLFVLCYFGKRF